VAFTPSPPLDLVRPRVRGFVLRNDKSDGSDEMINQIGAIEKGRFTMDEYFFGSVLLVIYSTLHVYITLNYLQYTLYVKLFAIYITH